MQKNNVNNNVTRRLLSLIIALAMVMTTPVPATVQANVIDTPSQALEMVVTDTPSAQSEEEVTALSTTVQATSPASGIVVKQGNQTVSVNEGLTVLDVDGHSYQFGKLGCTADAAFDKNSKSIVVMLWENGLLFLYHYDSMSSTSTPYLWDTGVLQLQSEGSGQDRVITGYVKASGTYSIPTVEELKAKMSGTNNPGGNTNNNQNPGNTSNPGTVISTIGKPIVNGNVVTYYDGTKIYTLSTGKNVESAWNSSDGTTFVRFTDGSLYYWNYALERNLPTVTLHLLAEKTNGLLAVNGYAVGYYDASGIRKNLPTYAEIVALLSGSSNVATGTYNVSLEGTTGYITVLENGYYNKVKVNTNSLLQSVGVDTSTGTIYLYYSNGKVKLWCYPLQKAEITKKLVTVSAKGTGLAYTNTSTNRISGYYENGQVKPLWSLDQIKVAIPADTTAKVVTNGIKKTLKINGVAKNTIIKKNNKVIFNGKVFKTSKSQKKVSAVGFSASSKHYPFVRYSNGNCYYIKSGKRILWAKNVVGFVYNPKTVGWTKSGASKDTELIYGVKLKDGSYKKIPYNNY